MITADELTLVENALEHAVSSKVGLLSTASHQIIGSGGKRLRPRVVLLSYKAGGGQDIARVVPLAAAVELLHTASLIHDDITDHSKMRRGHETVNAQWGNDLALLVGDFVFVRLLNMVATFDPKVIGVLAACCTAIVEGETLQTLKAGNTSMDEDAYLDIVSQKTASLFSACSQLGAMLAGATEQQVDALKEYGLCLGIAFQIRDDTLDLMGNTGELGKPVANDLSQGKMSLAPLFALRKSEQARQVLFSGDPEQIAHFLHDTGAFDYAMQRGKAFVERAQSALSVVPESEAKTALSELADFAVIRSQ